MNFFFLFCQKTCNKESKIQYWQHGTGALKVKYGIEVALLIFGKLEYDMLKKGKEHCHNITKLLWKTFSQTYTWGRASLAFDCMMNSKSLKEKTSHVFLSLEKHPVLYSLLALFWSQPNPEKIASLLTTKWMSATS